MGLTTFKGDEVRKTDVTIAKKYLQEDEIKALNRIVTMWLDFAEDQALLRKQVFLNDWKIRLDEFLKFNSRKVLQGGGKTAKSVADNKAKAVYEKFKKNRRKLKEIEGEQQAIDALEKQLKKDRK